MQKIVDIKQKNEDAELKDTIASEIVALLYRAMPGTVAATIVISIFLSVVLWKFLDNKLIFLWMACIIIINISRFVLYTYYKNRDKKISNTAFWDKSFYILLILNGLCFSVIGIVFLPDAAVAHHYFPIMVLIGMASGAVATLSFSMRNIATYFILLLFPIFIHELFLATFLSYSVSALILLLIIFSFVNAKKIYETSIENITLNYHSEKHTQQLIESRNTAIAANSAKTNFISMISHELRTPLNGMLGFSQLLSMSDKPPLNEEQLEHNKGIVASGKHLLSLIEELLDLSEIESHKMRVDIEEVSLADNLNESIKILNPVADRFNIDLINNVKNSYVVKADSKRLKQIFINLISNAIKYNHRNGKVTININTILDNKIRISILDTGSGLTKEQITGLFQPFKRYDEKKEGIGLGLYITQNLLEIMDGKIGVESEQGKGSTFWFELPLSD